MVLKTIGGVLLIVLLAASPVKADSATVSDISKQLICQCGCTLVLNSCTHAECGVGVPMTALINEKLAQGQSGPQIIQSFVDQYGEQVLASPPKKGFNLVVWILPFAAILTGGGVVYIVLKKWVWQGRQPPSISGAEEENEDEEYQEQLEKELEEFSEVGFR
jgi:cytochrome c-type biogenesis protein CcmH